MSTELCEVVARAIFTRWNGPTLDFNAQLDGGDGAMSRGQAIELARVAIDVIEASEGSANS